MHLRVSAPNTTRNRSATIAAINRRLPIVPQIHGVLQQQIVHCVLPPGTPLREKGLSDQWGVSRTPIREALLQLESEGLVDIFPQSGTRVSKISLDEVRESHFIREAMEVATVRFAALQGDSVLHRSLQDRLQQYEAIMDSGDQLQLFELDELFHRTIAEFRFRHRLWKITNNAKAHMDRVRHLTLPIPFRCHEIAAEHQQVAQFIIQNQPALAEQAIREHLSMVFTDLERVREEHKEYFVD